MHAQTLFLSEKISRAQGRRARLRACAAVAPIAMVFGMGAAAQADAQAAGGGNGKDATQVQEIVVTGSLITRRDFKAESPISTITADAIKSVAAPSLDVALGQMPQFAGAQGASEVGDVQGTPGFIGGQSYSDLRGIGPNRSLVLMDGRRLMPSTPDGSIDLNTIPMLLIQNVEVITGGASATYGSDAVAGVVNFKLLDRFKGAEVDAQVGETTRGDGFTGQFGGIVGDDFASGHGHVLFSFQYSDRDAVPGSAIPFFSTIRQLGRPPEGIINGGFGGAATPTVAAVNSVLAQYPGTTPIAPTADGLYHGAIGVNTDGTIFTTLGSPNCAQNYKGLGTIKGINISPDCQNVEVALGQYFAVQVPLKKYNVFTKAEYDLNDHITAYAQFNFSESSALDQTGPGSTKGSVPLIVPYNNPYVTGNAALESILASLTPAPTGPLIVTKLMSAFGDRITTFKYDVWQALGGFKGDIPGTSLTWDVYGSIGRSDFTNVFHNDISQAAINSILNGTANAPGCTGYAWNPLGNHPISDACRTFAGRTDLATDTLTQKVVQATIQGPLYHDWAGPIRFAVGADYRYDSFDYLPDATLATGDTLAYGQITPAAGTQKVYEFFGEVLVPLLKDMPLAQDLSVDAGYRYSKYDSFSGQSTWKVDVSWQPASFIRFRGGYSVAIRAPSLDDLHGPTSLTNENIGDAPNGDPCDAGSNLRSGPNGAQVTALCQAQGVPAARLPTFTQDAVSVPALFGSNPHLTPEHAKTWSVGAVITPSFASPLFSRIQLSVDYYNINISNAIGTLLITDILPRCFNSDGVSNPSYSLNNAYCERIQRNSNTGDIASVEEGLFNFATYSIDGIDGQLDWKIPLESFGLSSGAGSVQLSTIVSYLKDYSVAGLLGSPTLNYAGSIGFGDVGGDISHPHWKANTSLTWEGGRFSLTGRWRFIGAMEHVNRVGNPNDTTPGVPAYSYFDFDARYRFNERITLSAGINDIGDRTPPFVTDAPLRTDGATYDIVGRTWYIGLKARF